VRPAVNPALALAGLLAACGAGPSSPGAAGTELVLALHQLPSLDPATEGHYEAWLVSADGRRASAGSVVFDGTGGAVLDISSAGTQVGGIEISVEPPGDSDPGQGAQVLLRGDLAAGRAELSVAGAVTQGRLELTRTPGQFTMFTPSDNPTSGYPSHEESGVWLFNMAPRDTPQNDMWVRLAPLRTGWTYEGWMVRDYGTPQAIWLSYGKFLPDQTGAVHARDDTGWGPYSGVPDFRSAGEEEFPGDDWISNPLGFPFPAELTLPLDLREPDGAGGSRWTHVISIEPAWNLGEPIGSERPFLIRPYRDPFGDGPPGGARTISFREEGVPRGTAVVR
jgi:hypothetical protein